MNRKLFWLTAMAFALALPASAQNGPYRFFPLTPCRLVDTRLPADTPALNHNATRQFTVQGKCGIPVGAKAAVLNMTAVGPNGFGWLTLFPAGTPRPTASNINYVGGESAIANGAIIPLSASLPDLSVYSYVTPPPSTTGRTHFVLDATGYFAAP